VCLDMIFLADLEGKDLLFTYGLFGIQFTELSESKKATISALYSLLRQSADLVDYLQDENFDAETPTRNPARTVTFVAYWLDTQAYSTLKQSSEWQKFWTSLPDDAGVWREVMHSVPKSRYTFSASQTSRTGSLGC